MSSLAASSIYHERWNRSGRSGDCQINVCSMVPERLVDAISKVLNSKNFLRFMQIIGKLLARRLSLIAGLTHIKKNMESSCKTNGHTISMF